MTLAIPALLTLIAGGLPARGAAQQAAPAAPAMNCTAESFPVTLGGDASAVMTGHLCSRGSPAGKTLIYAVAGGTYDWQYWAWPQDPSHYSFAWAATLAGFDVLALDEPGTPPQDGAGGYPPAAGVTIQTDAAALHQVISAVSGGAISGIRFPAAVLAGHSLGSAMSVTEAARYHDPSIRGVDLTGFTHSESTTGAAEAEAATYPAQDDPKFASDGLPTGYLTTKPGTRGTLFYASGDASTSVISEDEALKTTTTAPEVASQAAAEDPALSQQITVPVDLVAGQNDLIYCIATAPCTSTPVLLARERAGFSSAAHLQAFVLPGAGHSINLATNAPLAYVQEISWALGITGGHDISSQWAAAAATWAAQYGTAHAARR